MYHPTNIHSRHTTPTEDTPTSNSTLTYLTQTDFATVIENTIKDLLANLDDKHPKQDADSKENTADQDVKFDAKSQKTTDLITSYQRLLYQVFIKTR